MVDACDVSAARSRCDSTMAYVVAVHVEAFFIAGCVSCRTRCDIEVVGGPFSVACGVPEGVTVITENTSFEDRIKRRALLRFGSGSPVLVDCT